ncbi:nuclear migration protein nudC-like protein [Tribonema minus]|uniref:Nuclear migration protein nudC-like protein n=1 Tax=Tribonema minus TaxID=303371 RepID=A0A835Z5P8_9STRA|nr:nuclear migration protein nudC-like protein [Tribonema minus]
MADESRYDELLMTMAGQLGSIDGLLRTLFSFLHRKTDFYVEWDPALLASERPTMGFVSGKAEELLLQAFQSTTDGGGVTAQQSQQPGTKQTPVGNGGACPDHGYCWTQTLQEVTVYVDVPKGTRGRDMVCDIGTRSLSCKLKGAGGQQASKEIPFTALAARRSLWNLDSDDGVLVVTLEKVAKTWWACALEGHPEIDTSKVDSTCKVGDYDEDTQAAIRKIMFDQKQKRMGLPTSDELTASDLLEKAKLAPGSPFMPGGPLADAPGGNHP